MVSCQITNNMISEKLPFEIVDFGKDDESKMFAISRDMVFVGPKKYAVHARYKKYALDIYNFEPRPDDVYLVGNRRTGTTLHAEMVWLIGHDLDYQAAAGDVLDYRFPHIDFSVIGLLQRVDNFLKKNKDIDETTEQISRKYQDLTIKDLGERKYRRFIKSHLPLSLLSPKIFDVGAKVIYCARNPKDMLVSLYNLYSTFKIDTYPVSRFQYFIDDFKNGLGFEWPYIEHVKEGWARRNDENFLFLFYEDTIKDKPRTIQRVADFLGKHLSKDQIDHLENHLNIEKFRNNKSVNGDHIAKLGLLEENKFIRKGKPGAWKDLFDEEMEKEFDRIVEEKLKGTDLRFSDASV